MPHYGEIPVRVLNALESAERDAFAADPDAIVELLRGSSLFDSEYYAVKYPDVRAAGADPLEHYVLHGWQEGRDPNLWFATSFYLEDNPDIADRIRNPLLHYGYAGYKEGRRPNPELKKRGKRLILVILADRLPLNQIAQFIAKLPESGPDMVVALAQRPEKWDLNSQWALSRLFERNMQLRVHQAGEAASALFDIMADYQEDTLLLAHPLAEGLPKGFLAPSSARARGEECSALNCAWAVFADGEVQLARQKPEGVPGFAVPLVEYGALIPPACIRRLLANAPCYLKYAPDFPAIWLAVQAALDKKTFAGSFHAARAQPTLDKLESAAFMKQLQDTMVCFRRELGSALGVNVLAELFKNKLARTYEERMREKLDWKNPATFTQKLQFLKLYDDIELRTITADKYKARQYIKEMAGEKYVIPLLGVWKHFDDIDFSQLPDQFILKTTHGSGQNILVKDKNKFDYAGAQKKFAKWFTFGPHTDGYEFNYFDIEPLIICEPLLGENLADYKFFCFYGEPAWMYFASDRPNTKITLMSLDWEKINVQWGYPAHPQPVPKPANWHLMLELSRRLSSPFSHIRVDFYELPDKSLKVGELTSYTWSGFVPFEPNSFDKLFGNKFKLP